MHRCQMEEHDHVQVCDKTSATDNRIEKALIQQDLSRRLIACAERDKNKDVFHHAITVGYIMSKSSPAFRAARSRIIRSNRLVFRHSSLNHALDGRLLRVERTGI